VTGIGHNNPPRDRSFKKRWASAIFACEDPKKPVGAVAMAFRLYHDMDGTGRGIAASDLEIAESCGVSDRSVRTFKTWLLRSGFVRVIAKGGRGDGKTEYRALIPGEIELPEKSAGQIEVRPETISGNCELNRKTLPEKENGFPEKISGEINQPEKSAGKPRQESVLARVEDNKNIYNKNNNLPSLTELEPAREGVILNPGEEHVGHGVVVNCETIRHRDFVISLKSIEMQLLGTHPMDKIKAAAVGHALQWALEIEGGKPASKVVPDKPANFIRGSIQAQQRHDMVAAVKRDAAKPKAPKLTRWAQ
jgi:hypothetical protein